MTKKLIAALLALTFMFSFAACSKGASDSKAEEKSVAATPEEAVQNLEDVLNGKYSGKEAAERLIPAGELSAVAAKNEHYYNELVEEIEKGAVKSLLDLREEYKKDPVVKIAVEKVEKTDDSTAVITSTITLTNGEKIISEKKNAQFEVKKEGVNWFINHHTF